MWDGLRTNNCFLQEEKSTNKWESVSFGGDDGDKAQAKFRRLMGIGKKRIHPL